MITGRSQARIRNRENRERENRETRERENHTPQDTQDTQDTQDHELYMSMFRRLDRLRRRMDTAMDTQTPLILVFP